MSEVRSDELFHGLELKRVSAVEVLQVEDIDKLGIEIYQTTGARLLDYLSRVRDGAVGVAELDGSIGTCVGGMFRSSRLNDILGHLGVMTAKAIGDESSPGLDFDQLAEAVAAGSVTPDGYYLPQGFREPLKTLLVLVDLKSFEKGNLFFLLMALKQKAVEVGRQVNLKIVVVDAGDNDFPGAARKFLETLEEK